eukprot:scaffold4212_cov122-Isochrysis_galbana.AAC.4
MACVGNQAASPLKRGAPPMPHGLPDKGACPGAGALTAAARGDLDLGPSVACCSTYTSAVAVGMLYRVGRRRDVVLRERGRGSSCLARC